MSVIGDDGAAQDATANALVLGQFHRLSSLLYAHVLQQLPTLTAGARIHAVEARSAPGMIPV